MGQRRATREYTREPTAMPVRKAASITVKAYVDPPRGAANRRVQATSSNIAVKPDRNETKANLSPGSAGVSPAFKAGGAPALPGPVKASTAAITLQAAATRAVRKIPRLGT